MRRPSYFCLVPVLFAAPALATTTAKVAAPATATTSPVHSQSTPLPPPKVRAAKVPPTTAPAKPKNHIVNHPVHSVSSRRRRTRHATLHKLAVPSPASVHATGQSKNGPLTGRVVVVNQDLEPEIPLLEPEILEPSLALPKPEPLILPRTPPVQAQLETESHQSHFGSLFKHHSHRTDSGIRERSWVSDVTFQQSKQVADSISEFVAAELPSDSTTLLIAPPQKGQQHHPLIEALDQALRSAGFGLVESKSQAPDAQTVQYQVSRFGAGVWLQVQVDKKQANRFFTINPDNTLATDAPFSIREDE